MQDCSHGKVCTFRKWGQRFPNRLSCTWNGNQNITHEKSSVTLERLEFCHKRPLGLRQNNTFPNPWCKCQSRVPYTFLLLLRPIMQRPNKTNNFYAVLERQAQLIRKRKLLFTENTCTFTRPSSSHKANIRICLFMILLYHFSVVFALRGVALVLQPNCAADFSCSLFFLFVTHLR